jgi:hypothetical protein
MCTHPNLYSDAPVTRARTVATPLSARYCDVLMEYIDPVDTQRADLG